MAHCMMYCEGAMSSCVTMSGHRSQRRTNSAGAQAVASRAQQPKPQAKGIRALMCSLQMMLLACTMVSSR